MIGKKIKKYTNTLERTTSYNFHMLSEKYQDEQKDLDEKIRQFYEALERLINNNALGVGMTVGDARHSEISISLTMGNRRCLSKQQGNS